MYCIMKLEFRIVRGRIESAFLTSAILNFLENLWDFLTQILLAEPSTCRAKSISVIVK